MSPADIQGVSTLLADDDEDDRMLSTDALREAKLATDIATVNDGEERMDCLHRRGEYSDPCPSPRPGLILLDLNMPKKDGREALDEIRADPELRRIPIAVLTTSEAEEDILQTYEGGVNSFITKPVSFEGRVQIMRTLRSYWLEIVRLPGE